MFLPTKIANYIFSYHIPKHHAGPSLISNILSVLELTDNSLAYNFLQHILLRQSLKNVVKASLCSRHRLLGAMLSFNNNSIYRTNRRIMREATAKFSRYFILSNRI